MEVIMNKKIFIILGMVKLIATPYLQAGAFTRSLRNTWRAVETHTPQIRTELNQAAQRVRQEVQAVRENISPAIRNNVPHTSFPQAPLRPYHGPTPINPFVRTPAPSPFFHSLHTPLPGHFHSSFTTPLPTNVAATSSLLVGRMTNEQIEALLNNTPTPQQQEQPLAFTGFSEEDTESSDTLLRPLNEERSDLSFSTETQSPKTTNQPTDQHTLDDAISTLENQIAEINAELEQENSHPRTFSEEETILFNQEEDPFFTLMEQNFSDASNTQTTSPKVTTETHALTLYDGTSSSLTTLPDHQSSSLTVIAPQESSALTTINNQSRALTTIYEEESALVPTQNNEFEDLGDIFTLLFKEQPAPYAPDNQQTPLMLPAGTTPLMLAPGDTPLLLSAGETPVTPPVVATQTLETLIEANAPFEAQNQLNNLVNPAYTNSFLASAFFASAVAAATLGKKPVNTTALRQALPAGRIALPHGAKPAVRAHVYKQVVRTTPTQSLSAKPKTNNYRLPTSLGQPKPKKPASTNFYKLPSLRPSSRPNTTPSQIYQTPVQPAAPQPTLEALAPQRYSVTPVRTVAQPVAPLRTVLPEPVRTQKITITPEQPSQANLYRMPTPLEPAPIRTAPQPAPPTRAVPETTPSTAPIQPTQPVPVARQNTSSTTIPTNPAPAVRPTPTEPAPQPTRRITTTPEITPSTAPIQPTQPVPAPRRITTVAETRPLVNTTPAVAPVPAPRQRTSATTVPTTTPAVRPTPVEAAPRSLSNQAVRSIATNGPSLVQPLAQARLPQTSLRNFSTNPATVNPTPAPRAPFPPITLPVAAPRALPPAPAPTTTPTPSGTTPKPAKRKKAAPTKTPKEEPIESEEIVPSKKQDKSAEIDTTNNGNSESPTKEVPVQKEKELQAPLTNIKQPEPITPATAPITQTNTAKAVEPYELILRQGKTSPVIVHGKEKYSSEKTITKNTGSTTEQKTISSHSLTVRSGLGKETTTPSSATVTAKPVVPTYKASFDQPHLKGTKATAKSTVNRFTDPLKKRSDAIEHTVTKERKATQGGAEKISAQPQTIVSTITHAVSSFTTYIFKALQSLRSFFSFNSTKP